MMEQKKKPSVTAKLESTVLTNGTDYAVYYQNNIEPGTATVIVTGRGNYFGSVTKTFNIISNAEPNYLTFTAKKASSKISLRSSQNAGIQYSSNGNKWLDYENGTKITLSSKGDKVMFRGIDVRGEYGEGVDYGAFKMTGSIAASGSVTSLTDWNGGDPNVQLTPGCYANMFRGCTSLTKAPDLPATSLTSYCYYDMFAGCTGLTKAPDLPATSLVSNCYDGMFIDCTGLTNAPDLPATSLASGCYSGMFRKCAKIKMYSSQSDDHSYEWSIPADAIQDNWGMFIGTEGDYTSDPVPGTVYYQAKCTHGELIPDVIIPADYLQDGEQNLICSVCGDIVKTEPVSGYSTYYVNSFKVSKASKAFVAKWKKQSKSNQKKFNGYQIRYSTDEDFLGDIKYATAGKSSKSKKIKGLKKKTKYYVQVRTYTIKDGVKYYSKWSALKKVTTK